MAPTQQHSNEHDTRNQRGTRGNRGARTARVPHSKWGRLIAAIVATVATLLLVAVGVLCVVIPDTIVHILPYLLGAVMVLTGAASVVLALRESSEDAGAHADTDATAGADRPAGHDRLLKEGRRSIGASFVLVILGLFSIACGEQSIGFLGTAWGLVSLYKVGGEFDEALDLWRQKKHVAVVSVLLGLLELVLALLLILNPFANIEHHVIVLGIELVLYPFKLHRERGERGAEVQV